MNRLVLYAKDVEKTVAFYQKHFGFRAHREDGDRIVELNPHDGGATLMMHPAGRGIKEGQSCVKLVFDVEDVEGFRAACARKGLKFGTIHTADGYAYSNARDPSKNPIQISSRAFRADD